MPLGAEFQLPSISCLLAWSLSSILYHASWCGVSAPLYIMPLGTEFQLPYQHFAEFDSHMIAICLLV